MSSLRLAARCRARSRPLLAACESSTDTHPTEVLAVLYQLTERELGTGRVLKDKGSCLALLASHVDPKGHGAKQSAIEDADDNNLATATACWGALSVLKAAQSDASAAQQKSLKKALDRRLDVLPALMGKGASSSVSDGTSMSSLLLLHAGAIEAQVSLCLQGSADGTCPAALASPALKALTYGGDPAQGDSAPGECGWASPPLLRACTRLVGALEPDAFSDKGLDAFESRAPREMLKAAALLAGRRCRRTHCCAGAPPMRPSKGVDAAAKRGREH